MSDHDVLDRLSPYFPAPERSLERFHRRRERKRRDQRIASAALALVLATAVLLGLVRLLGPPQKAVPADTPTPTPGVPSLVHSLPAPIAFSSGGTVYVMSPAGDVRRVAGGGEEQASFVSWADGGLIVRSALLKDPAHPCICLIPAKGRTVVPYAKGVRLNGFAPWDGASPSADSNRIVFARGGALYLWVSHSFQRLLTPQTVVAARDPVFAPNGWQIAFVARDASGID